MENKSINSIKNPYVISRLFKQNLSMMLRSQRQMILKITKMIIAGGFVLLMLNLFIDLMENDYMLNNFEIKKLMSEAENENTERLLRVQRVCEKYNLGIYKKSNEESLFKHPPAAQYSVFYIDRIHRISYCPIYKAGSTTWIYNLCLLMNVTEDVLNSGKEQLSTIARRVLPEIEFPEAEQALKASRKILVVRHPFERILSAYRDKLENSVAGREHGTLHFYRKYGAKIVKKYRDANRLMLREDQVIRRENVAQPAGIEPTFREFADYLIHTDLASYADDHWMPYYLYCTPCLITYDTIAKVETLWRDQVYAINKLGVESSIKPRWRHSNGHSNVSRIYFSQLNENITRQLYEKYRLDFELFDYSPDIYYEYSTSTY